MFIGYPSASRLGAKVLDGFPLEEQSLLLFVLLGYGFAASGFSTPSIHHPIRFVHHAENRGLLLRTKKFNVG